MRTTLAETWEEQHPLPRTDWKVRTVRHGYGREELQQYYVILWSENERQMADAVRYALPDDEYGTQESADDRRAFHRDMLLNQYIDHINARTATE